MGRIKEKYRSLKTVMSDIDIAGMFLDANEKLQANDLLGKYLLDYSIETVAEKNSLKQLIYLEILNFRLQSIINNLHKEDGSIPINIVEAIHKNVQAITLLKDKMGISKDKKAETQNDAFKALEFLKQKFKKYREENQATRHRACPYCGEMILWIMKADAYDVKKHPYFKDRILCNEHLMKMYLDKKIEKADIAKILGSSPDYIDWLVNKMWHTNPKFKELSANAVSKV